MRIPRKQPALAALDARVKLSGTQGEREVDVLSLAVSPPDAETWPLDVKPDGTAITGQRLNMLNSTVITQFPSAGTGVPSTSKSSHDGRSAGMSGTATVGQTKASLLSSKGPR